MPGVNFMNVLCSRFLYEIFGAKISNPKHSFVICCAKNLLERQARKTLMKLATGVNILHTFFTCSDSKSTKRLATTMYFFMLLGSSCVKALSKVLVKLTPGWIFFSEIFKKGDACARYDDKCSSFIFCCRQTRCSEYNDNQD